MVVIKSCDGTETYVKEAGDSVEKALVLLHGIGADHRMWEPQLQFFARSGYYVLAPDLLGHGESSKVETLELSNWEKQINTLILNRNVSKFVLVGVSMGGVVAQSYAMHYPAKVRSLVLADTFGELRTVREKILGLGQLIGFRVFRLFGIGLFAKAMSFAYRAPFAKQAREYFVQVSQQADFDQLIRARKAINKIDAIGKIAGERIPTLILVGDQFGKSFVDINRKIAQGIKGSQFVILENSMDPSNLVNPKAFNKAVLDFLSHYS